MMIHRMKKAHLSPQKAEPKAEPKVEKEVEKVQEEPKKEVKEEPKKEVNYTRDEINSLPFFSLKSIAFNMGIDVKGKKGNDLKAELIEKLGL